MIRIVFPLLAIALGYLAFVVVAPTSWKYRADIEQSDRLIGKIEDFRRDRGRIPSEPEVVLLRQELGFPPNESCPCYRTKPNAHYIVWFGTSIGSSYVYDSSVAGWDEKR